MGCAVRQRAYDDDVRYALAYTVGSQMQWTAEKHGWTKFVSMQGWYNLLYREEASPTAFALSNTSNALQEREMIRFCNSTGVGLIPVSSPPPPTNQTTTPLTTPTVGSPSPGRPRPPADRNRQDASLARPARAQRNRYGHHRARTGARGQEGLADEPCGARVDQQAYQ